MTASRARQESPSLARALRDGHDIVVASVNDTPRYLGMVDTWFRFWLAIGPRANPPITPIVLAVNLDDRQVAAEWSDRTIRLAAPAGVASGLAAQVARLIWPGTLAAEANRVITTDIDMLPLALRVIGAAQTAPSDTFVVTRNVLESERQFPICYSVAPIAVWRAVFESTQDCESDLRRFTAGMGSYASTRGGAGWFSDQSLLYTRLLAWEEAGGRIMRLRDADTGHRRLDRSSPWLRTFVSAPLAAWSRWTDFHAYAPSLASRALNAWLLFWQRRQWR